MFRLFIALLSVVSAIAFGPASIRRVSSSRVNMVLAPPGMKPTPDGGFKVAGAHPETFILENENGAKAIIDTETLSVTSWILGGKQLSGGKDGATQMFPDAATPIKGHFVPEERAKKLSFDRMIFKLNPEGYADIEYRVDVTLRADSLEYDVILKNAGATPVDAAIGIKFNLANGAKISAKKGYTEQTDNSVSTGKWAIPVGKYKETAFYVKIDAPK